MPSFTAAAADPAGAEPVARLDHRGSAETSLVLQIDNVARVPHGYISQSAGGHTQARAARGLETLLGMEPDSAAEYDRRVLYGRDVERTAILALLDGARTSSRSAVLVVRGEAGVGKSALLADAVEKAAGMQVIHAVGVESESELAFAGLHQIVWPLVEDLDEIPAPQGAALRGALGLAPATQPDRFLVAAAVLSVFAAAAERRPLLCIVDDAQWLDLPSADALVFAARRFHAEPIALLVASREGEERTFEARGLPELVLGGLDDDASRAVLDERISAIASDVYDPPSRTSSESGCWTSPGKGVPSLCVALSRPLPAAAYNTGMDNDIEIGPLDRGQAARGARPNRSSSVEQAATRDRRPGRR